MMTMLLQTGRKHYLVHTNDI